MARASKLLVVRTRIAALALLAWTAAAQGPGEELFSSYCAACHQYDGQAVGEAPPLDGAEWVTGPPARLILLVMHGVSGPMEVHGVTFDREMPGFGEILDDQQLATLLSYVRRRFGKPSDAIEADTVTKLREKHRDRDEYWPVEELSRIRE